MKAKITKQAVDRVVPVDRDILLWDTEVMGFFVRARPQGGKYYGVKYRLGRQQRWHTIGRHGSPWTPDQARTAAKKIIGEVADGKDPAEQRRHEQRAAMMADDTVDTVAATFIEKYAKDLKSKTGEPRNRSWRETERIFKKYVAPRLGRRRLKQVGRRDVLDLLDDVKANNGPVMANRVLAALRKLFNWAAERDLIDVSPIAGIKKPGVEATRDRVLRDDEIRVIWRAAKSLGYPIGPLVHILFGTGQRLDQVAGACRSEFDDGAAVWTIPVVRSKNKEAHEVPLSNLVKAITNEIPNTGDLLFPAARIMAKRRKARGAHEAAEVANNGEVARDQELNPISGFSDMKERLDAAIQAGTEEDLQHDGEGRSDAKPIAHWTFHDIRRTVRTRLSMLGVSTEIAERVIGHLPGGVRRVYDRHEYREEKRAALQAWAERLVMVLSDNS
jgi:hypothetical protein